MSEVSVLIDCPILGPTRCTDPMIVYVRDRPTFSLFFRAGYRAEVQWSILTTYFTIGLYLARVGSNGHTNDGLLSLFYRIFKINPGCPNRIFLILC